jgi:RNA polymerase sigma factor (sigma-70 family)
MAGDRSFADYVQEKLYNRIYKSVEEFVKLNGLKEAMDSLTEKEKKLFKDKFVENKTNVAIAKEMGISETMVRKNLKKMYEKLGSILTK